MLKITPALFLPDDDEGKNDNKSPIIVDTSEDLLIASAKSRLHQSLTIILRGRKATFRCHKTHRALCDLDGEKSKRELINKLEKPFSSSLSDDTGVSATDTQTSEAVLSQFVSNEDFKEIEVLGQFNVGFIIARRWKKLLEVVTEKQHVVRGPRACGAIGELEEVLGRLAHQGVRCWGALVWFEGAWRLTQIA
ncbi:hypothetical protein F5877DRAFT_82267 [Lentinula edodes]|nr:hypothetical protein F5877DRAFT_82267 [Lentinula edodes]